MQEMNFALLSITFMSAFQAQTENAQKKQET